MKLMRRESKGVVYKSVDYEYSPTKGNNKADKKESAKTKDMDIIINQCVLQHDSNIQNDMETIVNTAMVNLNSNNVQSPIRLNHGSKETIS